MLVRELVKELEGLDPDLEIFCYSENPVVEDDGRSWNVLGVEGVGVTSALITRDDDRRLHVKHNTGDLSRRIALISVTLDI